MDNIGALIGQRGKKHQKILKETGVIRLELFTDEREDPYIEIEDEEREKTLNAAKKVLNTLLKDLNVTRDFCEIQFIG